MLLKATNFQFNPVCISLSYKLIFHFLVLTVHFVLAILSGILTCFSKKSQSIPGDLTLRSEAGIHVDSGLNPSLFIFHSTINSSSLLSEFRIEDFKMQFGVSSFKLPGLLNICSSTLKL